MSKTASESYFENLCTDLGISFRRIPESMSKTPDYELIIDEQTIVTEVKEMDRNKVEQESDLLLHERGYGSVMGPVTTIGDRVYASE